VKTASAVVATIVVIVSCVGLFATLAVVPMSTSSLFLGPQFRSAAVAALSVIFAGLLGFVVYVVSKLYVSGTARILIIIATVVLAFPCPAGLVLAFVLSSHRGTAAHVYALAGGMVAGFAAIILGAWLVDFGERRNRAANKTARTAASSRPATDNAASASPGPSGQRRPTESNRSDEPNAVD
jgi:hypothetical protein